MIFCLNRLANISPVVDYHSHWRAFPLFRDIFWDFLSSILSSAPPIFHNIWISQVSSELILCPSVFKYCVHFSVVFLVFLLTCAEIAIVSAYFQLCAEVLWDFFDIFMFLTIFFLWSIGLPLVVEDLHDDGIFGFSFFSTSLFWNIYSKFEFLCGYILLRLLYVPLFHLSFDNPFERNPILFSPYLYWICTHIINWFACSVCLSFSFVYSL